MTAEIVERPDHQPEPVDQPDERQTIYGTVTGWSTAERRPVVPAWVRSRDERRETARLLVALTASTVGYHVVRAPWYLARASVYAPRGAYRLTRRFVDFAADAEDRPLRQHAVERRDPDTYLALLSAHRKVVRSHAPLAGLEAAGAVAAVVAVLIAPLLLQVSAALVLVAVLGRIGQPQDRPIVLRATVNGGAPKPTSDSITAALKSCGIGALSNKDAKIEFPHPVRQDGPGWRADIDLPLGVTAADVMDRRPALASGLRRPLGCVWPEPDADAHAGRLVLWVGMQDMAKAPPAPYPLRKTGTADYFGALPFGVDQRGRPVTLPLAETNTLIGSLPGGGKTAAVRCVLAGCSLDPTVELHIWELKGSGDLEGFQRVAHQYGSGVDDDTISGAAAGLSWLRAEVGRRAERVKTLRQRARDLVPDSKVTRELANRRGLGLHPVVFVVDEAQELFTHPEHGKQAAEDATAVIKRGRAFGVHLILATQRPDKDSLPTGVSANVGTRFCLRVMGQIENDMILGTSSYKNGIRATTLRPSDRGIGYLVGASDHPTVVRTYYLDAANTDAVVARAYALRERAGLLTGEAAGETVDHGQVVDVLGDVRTVFATAEVIHTDDLLVRLSELRPQLYAGWGAEQLALALRPHGVRPGQISIGGRNRNGYRLEWIAEALARRELEAN